MFVCFLYFDRSQSHLRGNFNWENTLEWPLGKLTQHFLQGPLIWRLMPLRTNRWSCKGLQLQSLAPGACLKFLSRLSTIDQDQQYINQINIFPKLLLIMVCITAIKTKLRKKACRLVYQHLLFSRFPVKFQQHIGKWFFSHSVTHEHTFPKVLHRSLLALWEGIVLSYLYWQWLLFLSSVLHTLECVIPICLV